MTSVTSSIRQMDRYCRAMSEFPQGAHWPHVVPMMVRAAAAGIDLAFKREGLPYDVALDVLPGSKRQIRRLFFVSGRDVRTIRLRLLDTAVLIGGGRTVYLVGQHASSDLIVALLDAIDASFVPTPAKKRGRPKKVRVEGTLPS